MNRTDLRDAYYIIEASILFPFVMVMIWAFIFLCALEYDKVLLTCDTCYVLEKGREAFLENKDFQKEMNTIFKQIKKESPYVACKNLNMSYSKKGNRLVLSASVDFNVPIGDYLKIYFFKSLNNELKITNTVSINKAQNIMRATYKLKEIK